MAALLVAAVGSRALFSSSRESTPPDTPSSSARPSPEQADEALFRAEGKKLAPPPRPAFTFGRVAPVRASRASFRWSPIVRSVRVRRRAAADAAVIAELAPETPLGTTNLVLVVGETRAAAGLWVRVRLPILPNNTTGWVPRSALGGYHFVRTHLVVDLRRLTATLLRAGRPVFRAPVGVGQDRWPTPRGKFYVREKLTRFRSPFYGPLAFGTSARSSVLTDWPDGGFIGIHGTNRPDLLPGRVSHGCIRLRNADIVRLSRLMPVGTPLTIT